MLHSSSLHQNKSTLCWPRLFLAPIHVGLSTWLVKVDRLGEMGSHAVSPNHQTTAVSSYTPLPTSCLPIPVKVGQRPRGESTVHLNAQVLLNLNRPMISHGQIWWRATCTSCSVRCCPITAPRSDQADKSRVRLLRVEHRPAKCT